MSVHMNSCHSEKFHVAFQSDRSIDVLEAISFVTIPECGAIHTFLGTIRGRDHNYSEPKGHLEPIKAIYYDAYESMAKRQISDIIQEFMNESAISDPYAKVCVVIRTGLVPVGEASILICASSAGRHFSHKATMAILNQIKTKVVIWKKIIFADGREQWATDGKSKAFWLHNNDESKQTA